MELRKWKLSGLFDDGFWEIIAACDGINLAKFQEINVLLSTAKIASSDGTFFPEARGMRLCTD